ncbi:hypothetical protein PQE70_gp086 [Bacillus phage vB_BanS_Nate]|uniref:Uncharacterized protein n=1 Tax=Bacillus phage vB_BanS_Nate TaxID=2894788 RepID=A0AAE9CE18_9CAUD|nr:hypothetical protein PQE70_gp086 [Bacillus phage vB_BanS_Nate]UGO50939.1 hypothetical protein NATE_86 [Bacillus phage vB_BanS_Nate]
MLNMKVRTTTKCYSVQKKLSQILIYKQAKVNKMEEWVYGVGFIIIVLGYSIYSVSKQGKRF